MRVYLTNTGCHLFDPGNSNDNVLSRMTKYERERLSDEMKNLLYCIENIDGYIKIAFPENTRYKKPKDNYAAEIGNKMPLPPDNRRFGN